MAVGLWDSSFKNAFHTLSYRFAAVILVILYSRGKGKELKDAEQGCIADTLTCKVNIPKQRLVITDYDRFTFQLPISRDALKQLKALITLSTEKK